MWQVERYQLDIVELNSSFFLKLPRVRVTVPDRILRRFLLSAAILEFWSSPQRITEQTLTVACLNARIIIRLQR